MEFLFLYAIIPTGVITNISIITNPPEYDNIVKVGRNTFSISTGVVVVSVVEARQPRPHASKHTKYLFIFTTQKKIQQLKGNSKNL